VQAGAFATPERRLIFAINDFDETLPAPWEWDIKRLAAASWSPVGTTCGWALARAHARSGDAAKIAGYLGKKQDFDEALADFSEAYADQNEKDYQVLVQAVREGRLEVYLER
jgi:uncharacterized protein (DUF2252 family)